MGFKLDRVHLWSADVADRPGGVSGKLSPLAEAGANLEFILTRREPDRPGGGMLYVAPITGAGPVRAAREAGLVEASTPILIRVQGDNEAGLAHRLTQQWAIAGISMAGLTMAMVGNRFVGFAAFDSVDDANKAAQILADLGTAENAVRG